MVNTLNCTVRDVRPRYGFSGVRFVSSNGNGCSYSKVIDSYAVDCLNVLDLNRLDTTGWVNENVFMGGGCLYTSSCPDATAGFAINMTVEDTDNDSLINNNKFIGCAMEVSGRLDNKPNAINNEHGGYNLFEGMRFERFPTPYMTVGPKTGEELIIGGYADWANDWLAPEDQNSATIIAGQEAVFPGGDMTSGPLIAFNKYSSDGPGMVVRDSGNSVDRVILFSDGSMELRPMYESPANPRKGRVFYDGNTDKLRVYDGTTWQDLF
jgi:hypothetical protein